jgi:hypothetical protein
VELSEDERELLLYHAATIDMNMAKLSAAEQGVKVSGELFRQAWHLVVRSRGLDPDSYRATWDGQRITIEEAP